MEAAVVVETVGTTVELYFITLKPSLSVITILVKAYEALVDGGFFTFFTINLKVPVEY